MKSKAARLIDKSILFLAIFLFLTLVLRYYISSFLHTVLASLAASLFVFMLLGIRSKKAMDKEFLAYEALRVAEHFLYSDFEYQLNFFLAALSKKYPAQRTQSYIKINDILIAINISKPLSVYNLASYYAHSLKHGYKRLIVLCIDREKNIAIALDRLDDLKIDILGAEAFYKLLKSLDALPSVKKQKKIKKSQKLKIFISGALSKKLTRNYLITSFVLLFGAYFSLMPIYFIVMASISLTLAVLSYLDAGKSLQKQPPTSLNK